MSWGNKLVFVFIAFAALIGTLVYKAVNTKFDLVTKDYYKEELRYQEKIDGAANAAAIGTISLQQDNSTVSILLPEALKTATAEGDAWFYCKTNAGNDLRTPVIIEDGKYVFDKALFKKDSYQLKLQLLSGGKQFYFIDHITIQ